MGRARTKSTARFARCAYCDFGPAAIASCAWVPAPFALTGWDEAHAGKQEKVRRDIVSIQSQKTKNGDTGYRSPDLVHAKHTLYHLSYIPTDDCVPIPVESMRLTLDHTSPWFRGGVKNLRPMKTIHTRGCCDWK